MAVQVLVLAALAAKWREPPRDALDTLVLTQADLNECDSCAPAAAAVLSSHLVAHAAVLMPRSAAILPLLQAGIAEGALQAALGTSCLAIFLPIRSRDHTTPATFIARALYASSSGRSRPSWNMLPLTLASCLRLRSSLSKGRQCG